MATKAASSTAQSAAPTPSKKGSARAPRPREFSVNNLVLAGCCLLLAYLGFATWRAFQADVSSADIASAVATPPVPTIKLHQETQRQGPTITVDQNTIGKENPFQ